MNYALQQRGRASIDFLLDLGLQGFGLEQRADQFAGSTGLLESDLPDSVSELQDKLMPALQASADFRAHCIIREWMLNQHGHLAMEAFEEIRDDVEPELKKLQNGPTKVQYDPALEPPDYWQGQEFHRSAGGWDGHDYMGFVHGELIHRHMVGASYAESIMQQRADLALLSPDKSPEKILEMGCGSGQYTEGIAANFPDAEIFGCDLSPRQLEQAQRRANEKGLSWNLFQAAAEDTGLPTEQFDLVTSYAISHEMPLEAQRAALVEAMRVLKPGGYVLIGDIKPFHAHTPYNRWKADFQNYVQGGEPYWRDWASTDQAELAKAVGFSDAKWFGIGQDQYPYVLLAQK